MKGYWEKVYKVITCLKKKWNKIYVRAIILLLQLPALKKVFQDRFTINWRAKTRSSQRGSNISPPSDTLRLSIFLSYKGNSIFQALFFCFLPADLSSTLSLASNKWEKMGGRKYNFQAAFPCHFKSFSGFNPASPILGSISSKTLHSSASPGQVHVHQATFPTPNFTAVIQPELQDTKPGNSGTPAGRWSPEQLCNSRWEGTGVQWWEITY